MDSSGLIAVVQTLTAKTQFKRAFYENLLVNESMMTNFTVQTEASRGFVQPTFEMSASMKPYSKTITSTDSQVVKAKKVETFPNKLEENVEPEKYQALYETMRDIGVVRDLDQFGLTDFILARMNQVNREALRNEAIWAAERNNSGTGVTDTINGFGTLIAAAATAGDIPTGQIVTVTGGFTLSNIIDYVKEIQAKAAIQYRRLPDMQMLTSESTLQLYIDAYRDRYDTEPMYVNNDPTQGVIITSAYGRTVLKHEISMSYAGANDIIHTPKSNLQFLTSRSQFDQFSLTTLNHGFHFDILGKFDANCAIYEYGKGALIIGKVA